MYIKKTAAMKMFNKIEKVNKYIYKIKKTIPAKLGIIRSRTDLSHDI